MNPLFVLCHPTLRLSMVWLFLFPFVTHVDAQNSRYHIFKGSDKVGTIQVDRTRSGDRVKYKMESLSEFRIIWKQVVRTSAHTEYQDDVLTSCHSSITVNGSVRDSSNMFSRDGEVHCYVHPEELSHCSSGGEWTTARMYFEEPINATRVFVESVLQHCPLEFSAPGMYTLTFPNKTKNHYVYLNGMLQEIQVIRPFFDLVFKKVAGEAVEGKLFR